MIRKIDTRLDLLDQQLDHMANDWVRLEELGATGRRRVVDGRQIIVAPRKKRKRT
jgi:hypothetical protein